MKTSPLQFFTDNIKHYADKYRHYNNRYNVTSTIRISIFLISIILLIYFANERNGTGLWVTALVGVVLFAFFLKKHQQITYKRNHAGYLKQINDEEMLRMQANVKSFDRGEEYINAAHAYAVDLDVFGQNSMFQYLNRTAMATGKDKLASWLLFPADKYEILERQTAVVELADKPVWRQEYQALGKHYKQPSKKETATLEDWLQSRSIFEGKKWLLLSTYIFPPITVFLVIMYFYGWPSFPIFITVAIQMLIMRQTFETIKLTYEQIGNKAGILKAYSGLLSLLEKEKFESVWIRSKQEQIKTHNTPASEAIRELFSLVNLFEARANIFYATLNAFLMLDHFLMMRLENWKNNYASNIHIWIDAVAEMDAANSLAGLKFANPEWAMPQIVDGTYIFETDKMGHMLLPANQRVENTMAMNGSGKTMVLTGSNMSGKSTFLRTIGTNMVLAFAGAPVCAQAFRISVMQVFTGMRTTDSLEENISSFYAELKRIKQLLDLIPVSPIPVFYFLDEILKGTNSQDRHAGAKALIRQLHQAQATGIISTHDLELGQLEEELPDSVSNYSFNSTIVDRKIIFDYKLTPGICKSFNALAMMQNMGIDING